MAACPSLNGFSFHLQVFTYVAYDPDDDESLERAKRSARTTVENRIQRQMNDLRGEQQRWEAEQRCDAPCVGSITQREEPGGPIQVRIRVGRRRVRAIAEMHLSSTWSCDEPPEPPPQQQTKPRAR